ncbi:MAG: terpene cyclase/mutase family protein [Candidatus Brocadiae bacterium]|nr:terpene cyclase/mutase family protein [Candidatus Brocadiia bacterium]
MDPLNRRSFLARAAGLAALPVLTPAARLFAEDTPAPAGPERKSLVTDKQLEATRKGLEWLAKNMSGKGKAAPWGQSAPVAVTALAGCAFMADGHLPGRGKYGDQLKRAIEYVLGCSAKNRKGYLADPQDGQSRMHGHGFATMFLAEAFGMMMLNDEMANKMRQAIEKAVDVIEYSQTTLGGWGYMPEPTYDEGSITVAEVMALRSCRNAGFKVEKKVINKGIDYLKKSANSDGSFKYSLQGGGGGGTVALTAGAVASMQLFGEYEAKEVKKGLEFLKKNKGQVKQGGGGWGHFFYSALYATMAAYFAGGSLWEEWFPPFRDELVKSQRPDGSWAGEFDNAYCTAYGVLTLAVPYQYLPIFQV